ncbi:uncharacterized protein LOC112567700 [Pomacea canaliculata]|uniref:uncharacterized protein LOC112567700 n=1 Tax=Pomacea canaliculata TaxID=400727 RepID=UPI000D72ECCD|nr:uncharacterized protein LOC112567700 [Pomacea canaliculata]
MTIIELLLLIASAMTNIPESKSLVQAEKKSTCGIRRLETFDMMLTCYFHDNIRVLQKDFTVYLYKEQNQSPMTVLSCMWSPKITCYVAPGYKYEDDIDVHPDHTNVQMLHANTEHVGMYTCQVMGDSDPGTCSLTEEQIQNTTPTSLLSSDQQTQSADEQSSADSELTSTKEAREEKEHKDTETQGNTVIHVVPSVVLSVVLIGIIIAVIIVLCRRRRQKTRTARKENDTSKPESIKLISKSQLDECHNEITQPIPGDDEDCLTTVSHLTVVGEDKQQTCLTENSTETDDKANKARDDKLISRQGQINTSVPRHSGHTTCCSPADSRTGIQERGVDDIQDDERNVDGGLLELQQSHIDAPKKFNKEEEEDSPVTETALRTGHVKVREVQ